jgi:hypothetical protein
MRYRDQLRIWESNYGRSLGWHIELDGRVVGVLGEPHQEDMFWTSYRITPMTNDPELSTLLMSAEFWKGDGYARFVFRSRALGLCADGPFPALDPFVATHRVSMRALYIASRAPAPWDRFVLKLRAALRARRASTELQAAVRAPDR